MSRLYFTPVDKAFTLGSSQIKDTQEEINQLTKIILGNKQKTNTPKKDNYSEQNLTNNPENTQVTYNRIGNPSQQTPVFRSNTSPDDN